MSLRIYNTLSRAVADFSPAEAGHVRMYVCGMTVYDLCHVGHARSNVAFDVVQRWLKASGYKVTHIRNITDIDDKIIKRAVENGETIRALTDRMIDAMHTDFDALGIARPTAEPRATEFVPQMLSMIGTLEEKGLAYRTPQGDVNYAVRKFPGYGKLSGKSLDELHAGERVAVLDGKDDPLDFVLWQSAKSEGAKGETFERFWIHNGFINVDNEKMSKSLGNFFTIREVLKAFDAETVRFFLVRSHYRTPLNYSDVHLNDARGGLKRLYTALQAATPAQVTIDWANPYAARFKAAMDEDFGTPEAVAVLFDLAGEVNRSKSADQAGLLKALGGILGILQTDPVAYLQAGAGLDEAAIQAHIQARADAKAAKNFAEADRIRKLLLEQGIVLKDSAAGTTWEAAQ